MTAFDDTIEAVNVDEKITEGDAEHDTDDDGLVVWCQPTVTAVTTTNHVAALCPELKSIYSGQDTNTMTIIQTVIFLFKRAVIYLLAPSRYKITTDSQNVIGSWSSRKEMQAT